MSQWPPSPFPMRDFDMAGFCSIAMRVAHRCIPSMPVWTIPCFRTCLPGIVSCSTSSVFCVLSVNSSSFGLLLVGMTLGQDRTGTWHSALEAGPWTFCGCFGRGWDLLSALPGSFYLCLLSMFPNPAFFSVLLCCVRPHVAHAFWEEDMGSYKH